MRLPHTGTRPTPRADGKPVRRRKRGSQSVLLVIYEGAVLYCIIRQALGK